MATSSAMSTSNTYIKYTISVTQNSQSVTNNTSNVTVSVRFYRTNTGYTSYGTGTVYCKINGTTYSASVTPSQKITSSGIVLFTKTLNIAHATDGTKTLTCSAWISHDVVTSSEQSYSQTLTTIPRKSTLAASNGTLGTAQTLTVTRQSSSFTHTITYKCGSASGTVCTKSSSTSVSFTPPLSLASQNTTGTTVSVTFTITTYNGSTNIGSNTKTISCSMPASVKPSVSFTVSDAAGHLDTYGAYIQGQSKFSITLTDAGSYGSTIKSRKTTADGKTYTSASITTGVISGSGTLNISVTVTDSRGRTATASKNVTVSAYDVPKITALTVKRCDSSGNSNSSGAYLAIVFNSVVTALSNKNSAAYTVKYKKASETSYTTATLTDYANQYSVSGGVFIFAADTSSSYDVVFSVADNFKTTEKAATGSSVKKVWSILKKGLGIAFGKVAEIEDTVEFAFKTKFSYGEIPKDALTIGATDDLNDYITPGYYVFNSSSSTTIANLPVGGTDSGSVEVIREGDATQVRQVVTRCSDVVREIWERLYYSNTWRDWRCIYKGGTGRILWSGGLYMSGSQQATLSELISNQPSGIVLVFSRYSSSTIRDYHFNQFFVHKSFVAAHPGSGNTFLITTDGTFSVMATKYLYIHDDKIMGNDVNTATGTGTSGVRYENNGFVLRYVIGV